MGGGPKRPTVSEGTPDGPDPTFRGGLCCLEGRLLDCASNYKQTIISEQFFVFKGHKF